MRTPCVRPWVLAGDLLRSMRFEIIGLAVHEKTQLEGVVREVFGDEMVMDPAFGTGKFLRPRVSIRTVAEGLAFGLVRGPAPRACLHSWERHRSK